MLAPWWMLPSPGSSMRFSTWHTIQPRSSSTTYQSMGKVGIRLPGNVPITRLIQARISSRPCMVP
jgi:hypothetical protein